MFSSRSQIDCLNADLHSIQGTYLASHLPDPVLTHDITGANEIISRIKSRPRVTKLLLDHNTLGSEGCEALFRFLSSEKKNITDIRMMDNNIGDRGLLAIARYLTNNQCLSELYLQGVSTISFIFSCFSL